MKTREDSMGCETALASGKDNNEMIIDSNDDEN